MLAIHMYALLDLCFTHSVTIPHVFVLVNILIPPCMFLKLSILILFVDCWFFAPPNSTLSLICLMTFNIHYNILPSLYNFSTSLVLVYTLNSQNFFHIHIAFGRKCLESLLDFNSDYVLLSCCLNICQILLYECSFVYYKVKFSKYCLYPFFLE